jgi:hypothetical protein
MIRNGQDYINTYRVGLYRVGQNHTIRYFWQGITQYTVIYCVHIRFWPTLLISAHIMFAFGCKNRALVCKSRARVCKNRARALLSQDTVLKSKIPTWIWKLLHRAGCRDACTCTSVPRNSTEIENPYLDLEALQTGLAVVMCAHAPQSQEAVIKSQISTWLWKLHTGLAVVISCTCTSVPALTHK